MFIQTLVGITWRGATNVSAEVGKNDFLSNVGRYIVGTFRAKTNITT